MKSNSKKQIFEDIVSKIAEKDIIVSLDKILTEYNKNNDKITISAISHAFKRFGIRLKELNQNNYTLYMDEVFPEKLSSIKHMEKFSIEEIHSKLEFPKPFYILKKILHEKNIRTKDSKYTYLEKIKYDLDYKNLTLRELYKLSSCKNKFSSFCSKLYSTDIRFKNRKIINNKKTKTI